MPDSKTAPHTALVDRLAAGHPAVPRQVVEEQVAKALEGARLFGEDLAGVELVETIATENVARVARAMDGGADLSEEEPVRVMRD